MPKKLTAAQLWLIHSLEALGTGAIFTVVINLYTMFQSGNANLTQIGIAMAGILGAILSKGISGLIGNPQTVQAGEDTLVELKNGISSLIGSHQYLLNLFHAFLQQQAPVPPVAQQMAPAPVQPPMNAAQVFPLMPAPVASVPPASPAYQQFDPASYAVPGVSGLIPTVSRQG